MLWIFFLHHWISFAQHGRTNSNHIRNGMNCSFHFWFPFYFISFLFFLKYYFINTLFTTADGDPSKLFSAYSRNFWNLLANWHGCSIQWNGWFLLLSTINMSSTIRVVIISVVEFLRAPANNRGNCTKWKTNRLIAIFHAYTTHRIFDATKCDVVWCGAVIVYGI